MTTIEEAQLELETMEAILSLIHETNPNSRAAIIGWLKTLEAGGEHNTQSAATKARPKGKQAALTGAGSRQVWMSELLHILSPTEPTEARKIAEGCGIGLRGAYNRLDKAAKQGLVSNVGRGKWVLTEEGIKARQ